MWSPKRANLREAMPATGIETLDRNAAAHFTSQISSTIAETGEIFHSLPAQQGPDLREPLVQFFFPTVGTRNEVHRRLIVAV